MKRSKKRNHAIIVLIVLLIALAIGYATFQTVLTVNGTATGTMTWNVHFTDATKLYEVTEAGAKGDAITTDTRGKVELGDSSTTGQNQAQDATVTVDIKYPGDAVILETEILNESSQPARLTGYSCEGVGEGLVITEPSGTATITEGTIAAGTGDVLAAKTGKCTAQFLVKWNPSAAKFTEAENHQKTFKIKFTYSQDTKERTYSPTHSDT